MPVAQEKCSGAAVCGGRGSLEPSGSLGIYATASGLVASCSVFQALAADNGRAAELSGSCTEDLEDWGLQASEIMPLCQDKEESVLMLHARPLKQPY